MAKSRYGKTKQGFQIMNCLTDRYGRTTIVAKRANDFIVYVRIMLPIAMPALISVGVLLAIGFWNDYFTIYMYAPEKATIAYGIQRISAQAGVNMPQVFAAMLLSIVPVLIVFACFQKTIMQNTAIGGLKG